MVDPDVWCHMVSLGHNELNPISTISTLLAFAVEKNNIGLRAHYTEG